MCALFWGMCFFTSNKTNVFLKKEVKGLPRQMCVYHNRLCLGTKKRGGEVEDTALFLPKTWKGDLLLGGRSPIAQIL